MSGSRPVTDCLAPLANLLAVLKEYVCRDGI